MHAGGLLKLSKDKRLAGIRKCFLKFRKRFLKRSRLEAEMEHGLEG